jgi:hypothetical protein
MEQPQLQQSRCAKCGEHSGQRKAILDTRTGRTFHLHVCHCGQLNWTPDAAVKETATASC